MPAEVGTHGTLYEHVCLDGRVCRVYATDSGEYALVKVYSHVSAQS